MEELYCGICKSVPKFPMILQCCLKTICKEHRCSQCPFCNSDVSGSPMQANNILSHYYNSNISLKCDRCEEKNSNISCHNCKASLCIDCSSLMHTKGVFSKHVLSNCSQLMNNVDNLEICLVHKLPLKYFCAKDWQALCRRCKENHNTHTPLPIETIVADYITEISNKQEGLLKFIKDTRKDLFKCKDNIQGLKQNYENCRDNILNGFKSLKQFIQWKEEELTGEIDCLYKRKKLEIEYFVDSLTKNEKKLEQCLDFIDIAKKLPPNTILSQIKYINHIIDLGLDIENIPITLTKPDFLSKIDLSGCQCAIENLSLIDDTFSINNSISNINSTPSGVSSFTKSPQVRLKTVSEKSITPVKSRSNSRESNLIDQSIETNPLEIRTFKKKFQSSTAIQVSWNHPVKPVPGLVYCLEYGVGTKLNNVEQFRQVYKGTAHTCIITDLLPKTSYRFRVAPMLGDTKGDWGEIITITTYDYQKIDTSSFGAHASIITRAQEKYIQFDKPGIIFGCNTYTFGKYSWDIKILSNSLYSSEGNYIRVGVSGIKSKVVHGVDVECQSGRGSVKIKVIIDIESGTLTVLTSLNSQPENVYSFPEGPVVPAIQYKPSKSSTAPVRMSIDFDV